MSSSDKGDLKRCCSVNNRIIMLVLVLGVSFVVLTMYPLGSLGKVQVSGPDSDNFLTIPIEGLDGRPIYLEDYKENIVVLEFMATWCLTCAQQEPILKELHIKYQSENVIVLAVSIDPTFDTPDVLMNFIEKKDIPWQMTRDTSLMMTTHFQISEISTTLIITPEGEVANKFIGVTDLDTLSRAVDMLL